MALYVRKASGDLELFDIEKFRASLAKAGAGVDTVDRIHKAVLALPTIRSTKEIYAYALNELQKESPAVAARYNVKRALLELGPAGFSFEHFIAELFRCRGYSVILDHHAEGQCVEHELDIVAVQDSTKIMIECKFHNSQKIKTDVKSILACKAIFDDMKSAWESSRARDVSIFHKVFVVTNTRFTTEALRYASCVGIELLSWSYPVDTNLSTLIRHYALYPITVIPSLSLDQKRCLIRGGLVLCRDITRLAHVARSCGLASHEEENLERTARELCLRKD